MFSGLLERLDDAGPNGDGVNQDDKLTEAIELSHPERGRDVDVGLAGASLHLDGEVGERPLLALQVIGIEERKRRLFIDLLALCYEGEIVGQQVVVEGEPAVSGAAGSLTDQGVGRRVERPLEQIGYRRDSCRLVRLVLKAKLHGAPALEGPTLTAGAARASGSCHHRPCRREGSGCLHR